jgi:YgiT-type zinc finger domain-containing protein
MTCDCCGQDNARVKKINQSFGRGDEIIVIEKIPLVVCSHCGESYFTADTLQELERLKLHKSNVEARKSAPVISYV